MTCIFCEILAGRADGSFVHRDERCAAFLDLHPVNEGHVLVVPVEHGVSLSDVAPETAAHMLTVAQRIAAALRSSGVRCEGVNLFLADGAVAGQEVFHSHLHVIPRFANDGFGLRFPAGHGRASARDVLDRVADNVRGWLGA